jgi:hypothetical protein
MRAAIAWLLLSSLAWAEEPRVFRAYPLYTPEATSLVEVARSVLGAGGKVIYDRSGGRLLILATSNGHQQVAAVLKEVNVIPPNVRIDYALGQSGTATRSEAGVSGAGEVVVTPDGTSWKGKVAPHVQHRTAEQTASMRQTLLIQSGGEGVLFIGSEVPFVTWLVQMGRQWGYIEQNVEMRKVGAMLRVQPRVIGNGPLVTIRLTPELSDLSGDARRTVRFVNVATEVTVKDGETISVGGLGQNQEFSEKFLVGVDRGGRQSRLDLTLTPHIEGVQASP